MPTPGGEQAKVYILGAAAVVGGVTLGWAAAQGWVEEEYPMPERALTATDGLGMWFAFNVGLVLMGVSLKEAVDEYGVATVAGVSVAIPVVALLVRELRS